MDKVVIFGTSGFAEVVHFYLSNSDNYEVAAFTKTDPTEQEFLGLPVVDFENVENIYPTSEYKMFIAVGYSNLNKTRAKFYYEAKKKGYELITYISPKASVFTDKIGDNCFIFEDNTIQPFVEIGNDVILWSGNHIGHHSKIDDHVFIASHAVISGHCHVKEYTFIGVNATIRDAITIERENIIGAGALILRNTKEKEVYASSGTKPFPKTSDKVKL